MYRNIHVIGDDDPRKRTYECEECGKMFDSKGYLNRHKTSHYSKIFSRPTLSITFTLTLVNDLTGGNIIGVG